ITISTWASRSPALSMHTVSWLSICGAGPLLQPGIYPSAMAQRRAPITGMTTIFPTHKRDSGACSCAAGPAAPQQPAANRRTADQRRCEPVAVLAQPQLPAVHAGAVLELATRARIAIHRHPQIVDAPLGIDLPRTLLGLVAHMRKIVVQ